MGTGYRKKLRDPRWQRKRLSILERADWRCEWCGNSRSNLQVHHGWYPPKGKERDPWQVPGAVLYCLCDSCHERAEVARQALYLEIGRIHPRYHWEVRSLLKRVQDEILSREQAMSEESTKSHSENG